MTTTTTGLILLRFIIVLLLITERLRYTLSFHFHPNTCTFYHHRQQQRRSLYRIMMTNDFVATDGSIEHDTTTTTPIYNHVKAILFDVDGTIADSGQLGYDATNAVLERNQYNIISFEEYCEGCIYITPDRLARHVGLTPEKDGTTFYDVGQRLGLEFDNLYIDLVSNETAAFFPGIHELLQRIPISIKMGILTNAAGRYAHGVIRANDNTENGGLYQRFCTSSNDDNDASSTEAAAILGADNVAKPKPYGDGLIQLCTILQVNPIDCVYIGDSPTDAMAATAAGMESIGVTWGAHTADKLLPHVTHLCNTVEELAAMLPQIE